MSAPQPSVHEKNFFGRDELLLCGRGKLFGPGNAQLPLPPMLMFDRIAHIASNGGLFGKGQIVAELDIHPELWFFQCHFQGDPVMPGCLGLDALWQLIGFYLAWLGGLGHGRALGTREVKFTGQVTPDIGMVSYRVDIKRVIMRKVRMGIADAVVLADNTPIYIGKDLRVGLFRSADNL